MKKTASAPNLPSLAAQTHVHVPTCKGQIQKRSVSVNSLHSLEDLSAMSIINSVLNEIQMESVLHVPAVVQGQCALNYTFPESILHHSSKNNEITDSMKDYASCIATPIEHEEQRSSSGRSGSTIAESLNNNPELLERYSRFLSGIRRNRRKKSET